MRARLMPKPLDESGTAHAGEELPHWMPGDESGTAHAGEELPHWMPPDAQASEELPHWMRVDLEARDVSFSISTRAGGLVGATRSLWKTPPVKPILRDVSASFPAGSFSAVMGPSGAGKSTLLNRLRSGRCTSGSVLINNRTYKDHGDTRRVIRVIPQDDILLPGARDRSPAATSVRYACYCWWLGCPR